MRTWVLVGIFFAAFAPLSGRAQTYLPTALTPAQVLAKARAARGKLESGSYHAAYLKRRGGSTISIDLFETGDNYVETSREGAYAWADGSYDGKQWEQDENGVVTLETGFEETANPFTAALNRSGGGGDSGMRVLGVTSASPACVVLELSPSAGLLQQRYYDAQSFLLRRVVTTDYSGEPWTYAYSNFRKRFGLTFAQTVTYSDGHPENASVTQLQTFTAVPAAAVHDAIPQTKPLFALASDGPVAIPAEFTPDGIIVRVTIGGRGLDFQLDSGAADIVLDEGVARQMGLDVSDISKGSFSGNYSEGRSRAPDFSVGPLHAQNVAIDTIPWQRTIGDRKVVGLLGGDFFASERVYVNFQNHTLEIAPSSVAEPAGTWNAMPIAVDDWIPRTHAKFNTVDGAFVVDLGADETLLYPHFFRTFHPDRKGDVLGQMEGVAQQGVDYRQYTFGRFDWGDLAFAGVSADVTSGTKFEEIDYDGLLGRNILDNFNLVFDYPSGKLYVQSLVP